MWMILGYKQHVRTLTYTVITLMYDFMGKTRFGTMLRELRVQKGLRQRQVAEGARIATSTVGNAESASHRVMGRDSAVRLTRFLGLVGTDAEAMMAAWEETPLSEYSQKQRKTWERRNALRSKAKNHDRLKLGFVELLGARLMDNPDDTLCQCEFGEPACLTCGSLDALGLPPFTPADRESILDRLDQLQRQLAAPPAQPIERQ